MKKQKKKAGFFTRLRTAASYAVSGYEGASITDRYLKQFRPDLGTADEQILYDLPELRARTRDLYRNNTIGRTAINTLTNSVIADGLKLQSTVDRTYITKELGWTDEEIEVWEDDTERRFNNWANSIECDLSRTRNFFQLQDQAYLNARQSGDIFAMMALKERAGSVSKVKIKHIEADMVQNPTGESATGNTRGGIKYDSDGAPETYYVLKNDGYSTYSVPAFGSSGRKNILHIFNQERPGQSRGLPLLTPVIKETKQLGRYKESELAAAVVASFYSVFIKSNNPDILNDPMIKSTDTQDPDSDIDYTLSPGAVFRLEENEDISTANPGRPNNNFADFVISILRDISMTINIPLEIFIKHFTSSFSASRAAMAMFESFIKKERSDFTSQYNKPIYEEWLFEEIISGRIIAPGYLLNPEIQQAFNKSAWIGAAMPQINEMVSVNAAKARIESSLSTHQEETIKLTGGDFKKNVKKLQNENKLLTGSNDEEETTKPDGPLGGESN